MVSAQLTEPIREVISRAESTRPPKVFSEKIIIGELSSFAFRILLFKKKLATNDIKYLLLHGNLLILVLCVNASPKRVISAESYYPFFSSFLIASNSTRIASSSRSGATSQG